VAKIAPQYSSRLQKPCQSGAVGRQIRIGQLSSINYTVSENTTLSQLKEIDCIASPFVHLFYEEFNVTVEVVVKHYEQVHGRVAS